MSKVQMRDVVVVVPGIMGSVLQKDGKDLWTAVRQVSKAVAPAAGQSFDSLLINGDNPELDELEDGIKATQLTTVPGIIAGLIKTGDYKAIRKMFTENFQIIPGEIDSNKPANYFEFPYDWRRDNRVAARRLKKLIDCKLRLWRDHSGAEDAKVILLAHSMGGLVARYYLEVLNGWYDCRLLITFGTPHRGSILALNYLSNGHKIGLQDLTALVRSFTSIYQLLPIYPVINANGASYRVSELAGLPYIDQKNAEEALAFHREIEAAVEQHETDADYLKNRYEIIPVVGIGQPTLQSATWFQEKLFCDESPAPDMSLPLNTGDGTVPRVSSVPIELTNKFREIVIGERHSCLQENKILLSHIYQLLSRQQAQHKIIRGPEDLLIARNRPILSVSLEDYYVREEPIEFKAWLNKDEQPIEGLVGQIDAVSSGSTIVEMPFQADEEGWRLSIPDLAPGIYRLTVSPHLDRRDSPNAVHDFFEVGL
ncbi:MAG: lecithin--cholesterol acyltransferase [Coleofasciculus chthonoplastes F3-SA18-01]|uniref:esterase/lipase family protein n=2 Tax=Coleofasciculus TaxID=669368 RepID=UPI0033035461